MLKSLLFNHLLLEEFRCPSLGAYTHAKSCLLALVSTCTEVNGSMGGKRGFKAGLREISEASSLNNVSMVPYGEETS